MVVKLYISVLSGDMEVKTRQQKVVQILDSKQIQYDVIDISDSENEEGKAFMQENSVASSPTISDPNPINPLPPQIFNDDVYCGNYDQFFAANECGNVETFLKILSDLPPLNTDINMEVTSVEPPLTNTDQCAKLDAANKLCTGGCDSSPKTLTTKITIKSADEAEKESSKILNKGESEELKPLPSPTEEQVQSKDEQESLLKVKANEIETTEDIKENESVPDNVVIKEEMLAAEETKEEVATNVEPKEEIAEVNAESKPKEEISEVNAENAEESEEKNN